MWQSSKRIVLLVCFLIGISFVEANPSDTTILRKIISKETGARNIVFIEPTRTAWQYDSLRSFVLPRAQNVQRFPYGNWIELDQYNNKFYLFYPCDLGNLYKLEIADTTVIEHGFEIERYRIGSVATINKNVVSFDIIDVQGVSKTVKLYLVDENKGIAIRENVGAGNDSRYQLLIAADKAKNFPLIVNVCDSKGEEFSFQNVNYAKLYHPITTP